MKRKHAPMCSMCQYTPNADFGKYTAVPFNGRLHVMLEKISHNLYYCPKCGTTVAVRGFKKKEPPWTTAKRMRAESHARATRLRAVYH